MSALMCLFPIFLFGFTGVVLYLGYSAYKYGQKKQKETLKQAIKESIEESK